MFKNFFKPKVKPLLNFESIGLDMHSHLLPGVDDGAQNLDESIKLINELVNMGYKELITTPHIMWDFYKNTPNILLSKLEEVQVALRKAKIDVKIRTAAEYYLDEHFEEMLRNKEPLLTLSGKYLLVEVGYVSKPMNMKEVLFKIKLAGYIPVLAHPERYTFMHDNFHEYQELKDFEVMFQLNLGSLTPGYGVAVMKTAQKLVDAGLYDFIGTDTHKMRHLDGYKTLFADKHLHKLLASGTLKNHLLMET